MEECDHVDLVVDLLAERVCQAREQAHVQVLSFNIAGRDA
jgi:hypothetical protein